MATMLARLRAFSLLAAVGLLAAFGSARVEAQGQSPMELDICPSDYMSIPNDAPPIVCGCSATAIKTGSLYGTNPYMNQSSPCRAALHAGAIGPQGGKITIKPEQAPFFPAVTRNGVSSGSFGSSQGFRVVVEAQPATQSAGAAGGATPTPPGNAPPASPAVGMELDVCPSDYMSIPNDAPPIICGCSPTAVKAGSLYGTNPYMNQSSPCRAALHAGAIGPQGGKITIKPEQAPFFPAVTRNGTSSGSFGSSQGFRVVVEGQPASPAVTAAGVMELDVCPSDYMSIPDDAPTIACGCSPAAVKTGSLYGTNPYMNQSSPCRAALHAGAIGPQGGKIAIKPERAPFFPAVARNGTTSGSFGSSQGFRVVVTGQPDRPAQTADGAMALDVCPSDYMSIPDDAPPITCGCSAAAMKTGSLYGTNPYMNQSAPCRAGLHAGVIGLQGGKITIKPERAPFYPAVTRNGTSSGSFGASQGFRVLAVAGAAPPSAPAPPPAAPTPPATQSASAERPSVDMTGKPIQAPVAETLRKTGRVQLYVNFATDQEKPLPSSEPILQELLATLQGDGTLRVMLIGHTDNQGGAPYNLDLSQRRAAAVYLWLIQHGVDSGRLRSDGRGLMEPIADNATEWGRALNRRVEVRAIR
jgi:outer membrane protein OmpA-like peptidoglycan-associated protein